MKKGFTLIEAAILLIVVGLVVAMVVGGSSLIDSGKVKAEMQKINQIQTAYTSFYTAYNRPPGGSTNELHMSTPKAIYDDLVRSGFLTVEQFEAKYLNGFWSFVGCSKSSDSDSNNTYWKIEPLDAEAGVCLVATEVDPRYDTEDNRDNPFSRNNARFACYTEIMLDDKNIRGGNGMMNKTSVSYLFDYDNCDKGSEETFTGGVDYLFKIY